jgi:hypothetical protein
MSGYELHAGTAENYRAFAREARGRSPRYLRLALLPQPLALLEVGASAGLTLLADRYSYD